VVDEGLAETGRIEKRSRLLPAHVVVYFVMAMAMFSHGYEEVMRRLVGGLQLMRIWQKEWSVPTTGAISQARERLGETPLKTIFEKLFQELVLHLQFPGLPLELTQPRALTHGKRRFLAGMLTAIGANPVTEGAFVDSELLRYPGNRARRLDHHLHGFIPEFR
jgi:hypothetical protein